MKKIIGIFIIIMLATVMLSAIFTNVKGNIEITTMVDTPVWEIGDTWTYNEHISTFAYNDDGVRYYAYYQNITSLYTIKDDTGDAYTLELTADNYEGSFSQGIFKFKFTPYMKYSQVYEHRKTDLAVVSVLTQEKGLVIWKLGEIGIPIPTHYNSINDITYTPPEELIPFPLSEGKTGTFPSFTGVGHDKFSLYFGLINLYDSDVSYEYEALDYTCEKEIITVPAGAFESYNISSIYPNEYNYAYVYYVPEVGFITKWSEHWADDSGKTLLDYELELISNTYKP